MIHVLYVIFLPMLLIDFSNSTKDTTKSLICTHLLFCFCNIILSIFFINFLLKWFFIFILIVTFQSFCVITVLTFCTSFVKLVNMFFYITHATSSSVHLFHYVFIENEFLFEKSYSSRVNSVANKTRLAERRYRIKLKKDKEQIKLINEKHKNKKNKLEKVKKITKCTIINYKNQKR